MYNVRIDLSVYLTIYLSIQSNPYHVHKHRNLWSDLHEQHECLEFQENPPLLMAIAPKSGQLFPGWWSQPLWKIWKSNAIIVPNIWKVIKAMFQSPPTSWSLLTDTPFPQLPPTCAASRICFMESCASSAEKDANFLEVSRNDGLWWCPSLLAKLVQITPISLWFMADIIKN